MINLPLHGLRIRIIKNKIMFEMQYQTYIGLKLIITNR